MAGMGFALDLRGKSRKRGYFGGTKDGKLILVLRRQEKSLDLSLRYFNYSHDKRAKCEEKLAHDSACLRENGEGDYPR